MRRALLTALLAVTAACGGAKSPDTSPIIDATTKPAAVTVTATGAVSVRYSGTTPVQRVVSMGSKVPKNLHFLSIAIPQPQAAGATSFRAGFNLYGYTPAPSATIGPFVASPEAGLRSVAFLDLVAPSARRFDRAIRPCSLTFRDDAKSGDLTCPALADAAGATVALRMHWDLG